MDLADLLRMGKQYIADALPGGSLNPEQKPVADRALYIGGLLDPNSQISQDAQGWHKRTQAGLQDQLAGRQTPEAEYAYQQMMSMAGVAPVGMIAWHGSPHKFNKFDLSKIGTGEGAQAYGHGLYLAESPEVAGSYAGMLAPNPRLAKNGEYLDAKKYSEMLAESRAAGAGSIDKAIQRTKGTLQDLPKNGRGMGVLETIGSSVDDAGRGFDPKQEREILASLLKLKRSGYEVKQGGELYKTDIPDEAVAKMLDWDKPLSQQAPEVQGVFGKLPSGTITADGLDMGGGGKILANHDGQVKPDSIAPWVLKSGDKLFDLSQKDVDRMLLGDKGESAYTRLTSLLGGQDQATAYLKQQGIPGIRYLDGGSRGTGTGTSNFVAFDPEMIRILERNGQPTGNQPWKPGEWKALRDLVTP